MRQSNVRSLAVLASLVLGLAPGVASAQTPPPPPGYAVTTVALDDVLMPLLVAAEGDASGGRPALAIARAQVILDSVASTSTLRVRAEGVRLVAQQVLAGAASEAQAAELVLEPLVAQSERDSQSGQHAMAIARLDFTMARVPPDSALAMRAQGLRQAAARMLTAPQAGAAQLGTAPYGTAPYGTAPYGAYGTAPGPTIVAPIGQPGPIPLAELAPAQPADPTRRGDGEVVELYITAAIFGVYSGFWIPFAAGLEGGSSSSGGGSAENLVYSLSMLAGGGLFALGVAGLDSGEGLRTGVAPAMSMGLRYGMATGMLMWGALDEELASVSSFDPFTGRTIDTRPGFVERTAMPFGFGLGGLLVGAVVGFGLQPGTSEVRFVETGGIWGSTLGFFLGLAAAEADEQGFAATAGGLGAGILTTAILAGSGLYFTPRRSWLVTLGMMIGVAAGGIVTGISTAVGGDFDPTIFGAVASVTSVAGLVTTIILTQGMDEPRGGATAEGDPDIHLGFSPAMEGQGGIGTVSGTF